MKKLIFSALACVAFAFSGFASNEAINEELSIDDTIAEFDAPCKNWITHYRSCGGTLYLCKDNYASDEELIKAVVYFDGIQCNGLAPLNPGTEIGKF